MSDSRREFRNAVLYDLLRTGPVPQLVWSDHAKERARELLAQGLNPHHFGGLIDGSADVVWSEAYGAPILRFRDFAIPLEATPKATVVVVTTLPSGERAWEKVYASGAVAPGRERRWT